MTLKGSVGSGCSDVAISGIGGGIIVVHGSFGQQSAGAASAALAYAATAASKTAESGGGEGATCCVCYRDPVCRVLEGG